MRNQVQTQKERSQETSIRENFMHYFLRGGEGDSESKRCENNLLQIEFFHVLKVLWDAQLSRNAKGRVPKDFNSAKFYALFA